MISKNASQRPGRHRAEPVPVTPSRRSIRKPLAGGLVALVAAIPVPFFLGGHGEPVQAQAPVVAPVTTLVDRSEPLPSRSADRLQWSLKHEHDHHRRILAPLPTATTRPMSSGQAPVAPSPQPVTPAHTYTQHVSHHTYVAPAAPAPSPSPVASPVQAAGGAAAAVAFAMAQVGDAYVWGGTGPSGWDCSGLVQAAWAAAGVTLPRVAADQYNFGTHVLQSELQPGDLVFYYSPISHVGMYIGNGQVVNAENPSVGVKVTSVNAMPYAGATRP